MTHDVTSLLKPGGNAIATVLGNGWHNVQSKAVWNFETARWRNRPRMLCGLRLRYTDGTTGSHRHR
ncbi:MAG: alpha-L-rhamnosidase N-terminal domain-containing protein [Parabacteroides merdae]